MIGGQGTGHINSIEAHMNLDLALRRLECSGDTCLIMKVHYVSLSLKNSFGMYGPKKSGKIWPNIEV